MGPWAPRGTDASSEIARARRGFRHARTGGAAPPSRGRRQRRWGHAGETKPPCRRASRPSPAGTTALRRPSAGSGSTVAPCPSPPCGRRVGRGGAGGSARSTAPHRSAPRRRSATHRAARAPPSRAERCAGASRRPQVPRRR